MWVSERLKALAQGAPTLWINSRLRSIAFLVSAVVVGACLLGANQFPVLDLLAYATPRPSADDWEAASAKLAGAVATKQPIVLLLGGSTARELTGSDAFISHALSSACGKKLIFVNASTSSQNFSETMTLLNAVPKDRLALVIIEMNYYRFEADPEQIEATAGAQHLPFPLPHDLYDRIIGQKDSLTVSPLHQLGWLSQHALAFTWGIKRKTYAQLTNFGPGDNPFSGPENSYRPPALSFAAKSEIVRQYIAVRLALFDQYNQWNTVLWARFIGSQRSANHKIVLLAVPESGAMAPADRLFSAPFENDLSKLRAAGAVIVDWRGKNLGLRESDFYDQQHLLESGRRAISPHFITLVRGALERCDMGRR